MANLSVIFVLGLLSVPSGGLVNRATNYKALPFSGISNKIADLVTEAFTNGIKKHHHNENRQDAVVIGGDQSSSISSDNNSLLMNGFLKLLGFDGRKIGAAAMNGIIFIAQMVSIHVCAIL